METIKYYSKHNYGQQYFYIVDSEQAQSVSMLTNKKTIDYRDIHHFENLGLKFEEVLPPKK